MTDDSNILQDLVGLAGALVARCAEHDCNQPATRHSRCFGDMFCDDHGRKDDVEATTAPAVRRLVRAGVLK